MRLLPREQDRLQLFLAGELARRRRDRGLLLNQAEAVALIADEVCEAARDGRSYAEVEAVGYGLLSEDDVLDGVAGLVPRIELEALFDDGMRLLVLHDPLTRSGPPQPQAVPPTWDSAGSLSAEVTNDGPVMVAVTSHFHFFEVNRDLRFDRQAAWGMRLAIAAGEKVTFAPGESTVVQLRPIGGARIVRGHGGLCDGPLDADGAARAGAGARARAGLPRCLSSATPACWSSPSPTTSAGPDELLAGWGGTMRDGLGVRAERGGVDVAITGGLLLDPVLGVRRTSIGVRDGRVTAVGRAGNPDTMDGIDVVLDPGTAVIDAAGMIVTPGAIDSHIHFLSPQVADAALAGGVTTLMVQDPGPVWNLGTNPASLLQAAYAAFQAMPLNVLMLIRGSSANPQLLEDGLRAGGGGLKIHEDVSAGPEQLRCALDVCDRFDVQLAIHTDGLNEAIGIEGTRAAIAGRTVHLFHIEGCGGGHAPNLLELAGDANMLCSSTNPTVPFGVNAELEHLNMVAAVHLLDPGVRAGDWEILRARVRATTMAAEGVLHDLGVIPMTSSDSQGMGRAGEVLRRMLQNAALMKRQFGGEGQANDNERVLRHIAKATVNPAITHGIADHVGSLQPGRMADCVLWQPAFCGVRPGAGREGRHLGLGRLRRRERHDDARGAGARRPAARRARRRAGPDLAGVRLRAGHGRRPADRTRARARERLPRSLVQPTWSATPGAATIRVDPESLDVTLDGEPVTAPPAAEVPLSARYLLG